MTISAAPVIIYPEADGKPLADNTIQFRLITTIQGGIDALFADNPNVFVAGDLFWYAVKGEPDATELPDIMVVFGRPRGDRQASALRDHQSGALAIAVPTNNGKRRIFHLK